MVSPDTGNGRMETASHKPPADRGRATFDVAVPQNGYRWWYVDGISDDGYRGIVVIAFIGSVFSPYYYRARQLGAADPLDYCSVNVCLYEPKKKRWAMTERDRRSVARGPDHFYVGRSGIERRGDAYLVRIDERSVPFGTPIKGSLRIVPDFENPASFALTDGDIHTWRPVAPVSRIELSLNQPGVRWSGSGYLDTNYGSRALEDDFIGWDWCRHGHTAGANITYTATLKNGTTRRLGIAFDATGAFSHTDVPPSTALPMAAWRVPRAANLDGHPRVKRTLEDTPFYVRSLLETDDARAVMHESLSLNRFVLPWVRLLLPFRMPRRTSLVSPPQRSEDRRPHRAET